MPYIKRNEGESIDSLLVKFHCQVQASGILKDLKKHEFYEKPSIKKRRKQRGAMLQRLRKERKEFSKKEKGYALRKTGNKGRSRRSDKQLAHSNREHRENLY